MSSAIVTQGLSKVYQGHVGRKPVQALNGLNLEIPEGQVVGFLGRNGAGKTTTIKMLCSLLKPTSGRAFVFGQDVRTRVARRYIGFLPENPYFYEYLTPRETIDFFGRVAGLDRHARLHTWETLADWLDLARIADRRVGEFSKGMRQRLGFATALVGDPPVLILDEPMSGLDPMGRRMIRELILRLRDAKKTVFFSSHQLNDVEQICDSAAVLVSGKLTAQGPLSTLLTRRIEQVEVIARGLAPELGQDPRFATAFRRRSEDGDHFVAPDITEANQLAAQLLALGAELFSLTPIRESLEDYFVRQQEVDHADPGRCA